MLTTWIPLAEVPAALGGLAAMLVTTPLAARRPRPLTGTERLGQHGLLPGGCHHLYCLTPHAALPTGHRSPAVRRFPAGSNPAIRATEIITESRADDRSCSAG